MRRLIFLAFAILAFATLWDNGAVANAACPTVSCLSPGSAGLFAGTFGCTIVTTLSNGQVDAALAQLTSDGGGHITGYTTVTNNNNSSGTTFSAWANGPFNGGTYCLNSDGSGYLFPASGSPVCPYALFLDITTNSLSQAFEARLMDSTPNTAGAAVCEQE